MSTTSSSVTLQYCKVFLVILLLSYIYNDYEGTLLFGHYVGKHTAFVQSLGASSVCYRKNTFFQRLGNSPLFLRQYEN